jgi:rhodanese-related sulfurtransferase
MLVLRALLIVAAGAALGFGWNQWSGRGFDLHANALVLPGDQEIKPAEAKKHLDKGALFLDARPRGNYEVGHIPGALSLPLDKFDEVFPKLEPRLRDAMDIVVYCAGFGCDASHQEARRLKEKGVPAVILTEGWPAWTDAGYPVQEGAEP